MPPISLQRNRVKEHFYTCAYTRLQQHKKKCWLWSLAAPDPRHWYVGGRTHSSCRGDPGAAALCSGRVLSPALGRNACFGTVHLQDGLVKGTSTS